jgi:hypothetical protein
VVICKTCEAIKGGLKCVVFFLLCIVNLKDGVMSTRLSNLFGLMGLCYKVQSRIWVNVVMGLCGLKKLRRGRRSMGSKERY